MDSLNRQVRVSGDILAGVGAGAVVEKSGKPSVCAARRFHSTWSLRRREQGALGMQLGPWMVRAVEVGAEEFTVDFGLGDGGSRLDVDRD